MGSDWDCVSGAGVGKKRRGAGVTDSVLLDVEFLRIRVMGILHCRMSARARSGAENDGPWWSWVMTARARRGRKQRGAVRGKASVLHGSSQRAHRSMTRKGDKNFFPRV